MTSLASSSSCRATRGVDFWDCWEAGGGGRRAVVGLDRGAPRRLARAAGSGVAPARPPPPQQAPQAAARDPRTRRPAAPATVVRPVRHKRVVERLGKQLDRDVLHAVEHAPVHDARRAHAQHRGGPGLVARDLKRGGVDLPVAGKPVEASGGAARAAFAGAAALDRVQQQRERGRGVALTRGRDGGSERVHASRPPPEVAPAPFLARIPPQAAAECGDCGQERQRDRQCERNEVSECGAVTQRIAIGKLAAVDSEPIGLSGRKGGWKGGG